MTEFDKFFGDLSDKLKEALSDDWEEIQTQYTDLGKKASEQEGEVPMEFYLLRALLVMKEHAVAETKEVEA